MHTHSQHVHCEGFWDLTQVYLEQKLGIDVILHYPSQFQFQREIKNFYPVGYRTRDSCARHLHHSSGQVMKFMVCLNNRKTYIGNESKTSRMSIYDIFILYILLYFYTRSCKVIINPLHTMVLLFYFCCTASPESISGNYNILLIFIPGIPFNRKGEMHSEKEVQNER